jgi:hypothetical protein
MTAVCAEDGKRLLQQKDMPCNGSAGLARLSTTFASKNL